MKGTRVKTTSMFYSALPAQRTSTQTSSKNSKIIYLKTQRLRIFRNIGMNSSLLIAQLPKIMISVDVSSQMTPSVIAGPNNRRFILRPVEHADKYHKLKETELSRKRPAPTENQNPPPADIVVKKKCTNTLVGKGGQLATYENCSQIGSKGGEKVKITVKDGNIRFTQKTLL